MERQNSFTGIIDKEAHKILKNFLMHFPPCQGYTKSLLGNEASVGAEPSLIFVSRGFCCYTVYIISHFHVF